MALFDELESARELALLEKILFVLDHSGASFPRRSDLVRQSRILSSTDVVLQVYFGIVLFPLFLFKLSLGLLSAVTLLSSWESWQS